MKTPLLAGLAAAALLLSGCALLKEKAAGYYLGKARKAAAAQNPAQAEVEAAFADIERAISYDPGSEAAVELLGRLSDAASRSGFAGTQELEAAALKKALAASPLNWHAREALINFYASRGDTGGLESMAVQARELYASADAGVKYCALLAALAARASALPWLESEAYLALNKSPAALFEKAAAYASGGEKIKSMKAELDRMAATDPAVKRAAPAVLASAAEVAVADALRDPAVAAGVAAFNARAASEDAFKKAVEMTVQGNASLVKKDYAQARAFYQGALNHYPALVDARRQLAEADFQEGAALAAAGQDRKASSQLLYKAYGEISAVIKEASRSGNLIPFVKGPRFLGEAYSLKAAGLAALRAVEGGRLRDTARLEAEFKAALDEALKLNPEGRLPREMLERYTKEGF